MAAKPRRITHASVGAGTVDATDHYGSPIFLPVAELIRPELIRAATLAYPGIPGNRWLRHGNDVIRLALTHADLPTGIGDGVPDGWSPKRVSAPPERRAVGTPNSPRPAQSTGRPITDTPVALPGGLDGLLLEVLRPLVVAEVARVLSGMRFTIQSTEGA